MADEHIDVPEKLAERTVEEREGVVADDPGYAGLRKDMHKDYVLPFMNA